jgi:hypothetical protein
MIRLYDVRWPDGSTGKVEVPVINGGLPPAFVWLVCPDDRISKFFFNSSETYVPAQAWMPHY